MKLSTLRSTLALALILGGMNARAGIQKFDSDEFNSIISENQKNEQSLRQALQKEDGNQAASSDWTADLHTKTASQVVGVQPEENIVSPTTDFTGEGHDRITTHSDRLKMKRVSQEIHDMDAN